MVDFFIVSKCPMEGLYKNEKLARQVSASYKEAVIKRFEAPDEIPVAQKYCSENLITVHQHLWQSISDRAKAQEAVERAETEPLLDPDTEEAETFNVNFPRFSHSNLDKTL